MPDRRPTNNGRARVGTLAKLARPRPATRGVLGRHGPPLPRACRGGLPHDHEERDPGGAPRGHRLRVRRRRLHRGEPPYAPPRRDALGFDALRLSVPAPDGCTTRHRLMGVRPRRPASKTAAPGPDCPPSGARRDRLPGAAPRASTCTPHPTETWPWRRRWIACCLPGRRARNGQAGVLRRIGGPVECRPRALTSGRGVQPVHAVVDGHPGLDLSRCA
jgi:hypothetical protein